jgi:predicted O-linked N-acetylglucosamine transferase (SPINDLY family)
MSDVGRNEPCPCGSGKKFKRCCGAGATGARSGAKPEPVDIPNTFRTAFAHHQEGRLAEARSLYETILKVSPGQPDTLHLLGLVAHKQGDLDRAVELIRKSIKARSDLPEAHYNLGVVLQEQGKLDDAIASYRKAAELNPGYAEAHYNLGNVLSEREELAGAATAYGKAIALDPDDAAVHDNLGHVLHRQGRLPEAVTSYRRALALAPSDAETHNNLGIALHEQGLLDEAHASYKTALSISPEKAEALSNLGATLYAQNKATEAVAACEQAISLDPRLAKAHVNLGIAQSLLGQLDDALASFRRALDIDPDFVDARGFLLFVHNYRLDTPAAEMLAEAQAYGRQLAARAHRFTSWKGSTDPARPLRIGFVSADLCDHPVAYFLESVLGKLPARQLRLIAYPTHLRNDAVSARLSRYFEAWRPLVGMSDAEAARAIHDDAIDILIDLSGHTAGNRLPVFAWKPAPVQVTWLGYFATTGVAEIDYLIADAWSVPESEEVNFTEKIWRLPETRLCFTPPDANIEIAALPAQARGAVTFGCFNNLAKVNDEVVALWSRVLEAVPGSRLMLKAFQFSEEAAMQGVRDRFAAHGISDERLVLERPSRRAEYLASYDGVDIALDPFPFPGGTTTIEALWMGVPVLTLAGERMISRQGVTLLMNAGLADWIARDADEYVAKARSHAADLGKLAALRAGLRDRLRQAPVLDAQLFAGRFEGAFRGMWLDHVRRQSVRARS